MNVDKITNKEIEDEFYRIIQSYDHKTLVDLFCDTLTFETKKDWVKSFHEE